MMIKRVSIIAIIFFMIITVFYLAAGAYHEPLAEVEQCTENIKGACISVQALPEKLLQLMQ